MNEDAPPKVLTHIPLSHINTAATTIPLKRKQGAGAGDDVSTEAISCICGFTYDDGFSIACDDCSRWCHAACFNIVEGEVPEEWRCWECVPMVVDRERAVKLQSMRAKQMTDQRENMERVKRRSSPGVDRKHRRVSAPAIDGSNNTKRKRRVSMLQPATPVQNEDEHIDIDEPWIHSYVHISEDIVPHQDTRDKLRRQAQQWRGVTALSPSDPLPNTSIQPLDNSAYSHLFYTNPLVRPPSYGVHTTHPIPSERLITPYTSTITPSSTYLSDPLNAYAHLGMPKPFVHLVGPPLDLTLDSRITGDKGRFVRSGCRPNAVLRPVLCPSDRAPETLSFGVFALRDLKANEEVVLGWEWDDGNAVHNLPALIESPYAFPPHQLHHFRNQMSNILHTLASTFTTCACGARARDCALTQMAAFVDAQTPPVSPPGVKVDLGPLIGSERGFRTRERVPYSGGMSGVEMWEETTQAKQPGGEDPPMRSSAHPIQRTPSIPSDPHDSHRRSPSLSADKSNPHHELRPPDPGPNDMDVDAPETEEKMPPKMRKRWMHRESDALREVNGMSPGSPAGSTTSLGSIGPVTPIDVGLSVKSYVEEDQGRGGDSDESNDMPPPPMPAALDPTTISSVSIRPKAGSGPQRRKQPHISHLPSPTSSMNSPAITSPSAFFAQLSLQSPLPLSPQPPPTLTGGGQRHASRSPPEMTWSPFRRICDDTEETAQPEEAGESAPCQPTPLPPPRPPSPPSVLENSTPGPSTTVQPHETLSPPTPTTPVPTTADTDRHVSPLPHTKDDSVSPPQLPHDSPTPSSSGGSHPSSPSVAHPRALNQHASPQHQPYVQPETLPPPSPPPQPAQTDESRNSVESGDHDHHEGMTSPPPRPPTPPPPNEAISPGPSQDSEKVSPPSPRPPPQKVRLSLQDFARRRRQMREAGRTGEGTGTEAKESSGVGERTNEAGARREDSGAEARDTQEVGRAQLEQEDGGEPEGWTETKASGTGAGEVEGLRRQSDEKMDIVLDGHPQAHPLVDIAPPRSPPNIHVPAEITRHAKAEILDDIPIPQLAKTPTLFSRISPSTSIQSSAPSQHMASPTPPPSEFDANSHRPSHEDGEILNPIPSKPFPFKRSAYIPPSTSEEPFPFARKQSAHIPHSHTPPTRPRSFHTSPSTSPSMHPRRPSNPAYRPPAPQQPHPPPPSSGATNPPPVRPLPSGPRALRCAGTTAGGGGGTSYAPSSYSSRSVSGPHAPIPRGPSADRDWDRDRERAWQPPPRSRWSSGAGGWSR